MPDRVRGGRQIASGTLKAAAVHRVKLKSRQARQECARAGRTVLPRGGEDAFRSGLKGQR